MGESKSTIKTSLGRIENPLKPRKKKYHLTTSLGRIEVPEWLYKLKNNQK